MQAEGTIQVTKMQGSWAAESMLSPSVRESGLEDLGKLLQIPCQATLQYLLNSFNCLGAI